MKKFALIPMAALLLFGSCSKDNEPVITIPDKPIQTQQPVADHVTMTFPKQLSTAFEQDGNLYCFSYENGLKITYQMATTNGARVAVVKKISGAQSVTIPVSVTGKISDTETADWAVIGIDPYYEGVSEEVERLILPNSCFASNTSGKAIDAAQMRKIISHCPGLKALELEENYPGFVSIKGCVYSEDMLVLVAVPRAFAGELTVAEGTTTIDANAVAFCEKLEIVTLPASVEVINTDAFNSDSSLVVVNILADEAPIAYEGAFGHFVADYGVLRIKKGSLKSYKIAKPEIDFPDEPVEPQMPEGDFTEEEMDQYFEEHDKYEAEMAVYREKLNLYNEAWEAYDNKLGYVNFKKIEEKF